MCKLFSAQVPFHPKALKSDAMQLLYPKERPELKNLNLDSKMNLLSRKKVGMKIILRLCSMITHFYIIIRGKGKKSKMLLSPYHRLPQYLCKRLHWYLLCRMTPLSSLKWERNHLSLVIRRKSIMLSLLMVLYT